MGFLRFLKKSKVKTEDLDVPPPFPPPPLEASEEELGLTAEEELPPLPEIKEEPEEITPIPPETPAPQEAILEPGPVPIEELPIIPKPEIKEPFKRIEEKEIKRIKPIFVEVDIFRNNVLKNIAIIKNELKNSNEILSELGKLEQNESNLFKDWYSKMEDVQKRLMSIDKIIFKR